MFGVFLLSKYRSSIEGKVVEVYYKIVMSCTKSNIFILNIFKEGIIMMNQNLGY